MICLRKALEVEVIQYTGENIEDAKQFIKQHLIELTDGTFYMPIIDGVWRVTKGDYVVKAPNGNCWPVSQKVFNELYEVIE